MTDIARRVESTFRERFKETPRLFYSPGRINLIGEHVDYNDGYVMPGAIDKGIFFAMSLNDSASIECYSIDFDENISVPLAEVKKTDGWKNYVLGVVHEFQKIPLPVKGFHCVFGGNIPIGAGMSSSAALEGGIAFGLNELCRFGKSTRELALLDQRAEHGFPGVQCGIMDQYANMLGRKDHVLLLDCRNVSHEYIPFHTEGYEIILINTKVHHSLASSQYNQRREECGKGLAVMQERSGIHSFRDIEDPSVLLAYQSEMGEKVYSRCRYVVEEIRRTRSAANLLRENKMADFGELMFETHAGLRDLYQVSCPELDFLVEAARKHEGVAGARLMGGGFGGCTINLVKTESVSSFLRAVLPSYTKQFQLEAENYDVKIASGACELK